MIEHVSAAAAGRFTIGDITVNRLGFGAMRITGEGVWGPPRDPEAARETLKALRGLDVNLIDTADSYGPFVSEDLIREVLYPYEGMLIATKGGFLRTGPGDWTIDGKPEYLRQAVLMSLRRLGIDRIDLWQLHRIDDRYPRAEQFGVIAAMQKEGLIRHVGLSEVSVDDIKEAQQYFPVVTVQNMYNLTERKSEAVLEFCEAQNIGFIPWFPLAAGDLAEGDSAFAHIASRLKITPSQLALAWILKRSKVMLPIPGTSNPDHLRENVAAASVELTDDDFAAIEKESHAR
ncbi:MAG TPA: aldo/keto reductase [Candidatus Aquilonibacter sp.]|nr:aldo/keto reductase [Candidatus Aquilonibacter sp.]